MIFDTSLLEGEKETRTLSHFHVSPRRCKLDGINCSYSVCQHHFTCMCLILSLHLQIPSCFYKLTCRFNLLFRWFWIIIRNILKNVHQHQIFCNSANPNFKYFSHLCCCCKTVVIVFTAVPIDPTCCWLTNVVVLSLNSLTYWGYELINLYTCKS